MNACTTTQSAAFAPTHGSQAVRIGRAIHRGFVATVEAVEAYAVLEIAALLSTMVCSAIFLAASFGYSLFR